MPGGNNNDGAEGREGGMVANYVKVQVTSSKRVIAAMTTKRDSIDLSPWDAELQGSTYNASNSEIADSGTVCTFECAYTVPEKALMALSKFFKDDAISVKYADEDVGRNCGTVTFFDGYVAARWMRGSRGALPEAEEAEWVAWARAFRGEPTDDEEGEGDDFESLPPPRVPDEWRDDDDD